MKRLKHFFFLFALVSVAEHSEHFQPLNIVKLSSVTIFPSHDFWWWRWHCVSFGRFELSLVDRVRGRRLAKQYKLWIIYDASLLKEVRPTRLLQPLIFHAETSEELWALMMNKKVFDEKYGQNDESIFIFCSSGRSKNEKLCRPRHTRNPFKKHFLLSPYIFHHLSSGELSWR